MSNLVEEIHSIIENEVRADWMSLIEARLAQLAAALVYLLSVWASLDNTRREMILEKMQIEMNDICTMIKGRRVYPDQTIVTEVAEPLVGTFIRDIETPMGGPDRRLLERWLKEEQERKE